MPLMGSLYLGASGLQTSQNALNTTAHNMSNVDTKGYTRQMVQQSASMYNTISKSGSAVAYQQLGLGVVYTETKTARDYFLDKTYRRESGRSAFYEVSAETLEEVEDLLQELDGESFQQSFNNLWKSVQDLANVPDQAANQSVFVQRCYEFLTRADSVYKGLVDYQYNLNASIKTDVDRINDIGHKINDLNQRIQRIESGGTEHANDLRDQRNLLLDELSGLADISCSTDVFGNITVKLEGNDFVKTDSVNEISLYPDPVTGFYTPYWKQLATYYTDANGDEQVDIESASVFNLDQEIKSEMNTDIGGLKSKLLARGDHHGTYQDLENAEHYDQNISQSVLMNVQAEFDQLVHLVTTAINGVLKDAAEAAGPYPDSTYLRDSDGEPLQVFNKISPDGEYSLNNIIINDELRQAPTLLGFRKADGKADYEITAKLKALFDEKNYTLNPNTETKVNLAGYYDSLVSQVANTASVAREISDNQALTVSETEAARDQVIGVATDEELSNMVMFQNAYNASSRYINVISEMLEHIINTLGRG